MENSNNNYVINTKVIVGCCAIIFMAVIGILANKWVESEANFKERCASNDAAINEKLNILLGDYKVQVERISSMQDVNRSQNERLDIQAERLTQLYSTLFTELSPRHQQKKP